MAELNLRPCQKCKGAAELKEGFIAGYYVECENGCCYTPILPNKIMAVNQWNIKRVVVRACPVIETEGGGAAHVNDT